MPDRSKLLDAVCLIGIGVLIGLACAEWWPAELGTGPLVIACQQIATTIHIAP